MGWIFKVWVTFRLSELTPSVSYCLHNNTVTHKSSSNTDRLEVYLRRHHSDTQYSQYRGIKLPNLWDSSVGIVTRLWAGRSGVRIPAGAGYFSLLQKSTLTPNPTQPPIQPCFFSEVKAEGRDVGHSRAPVELKNECSCTLSPPYMFS